MVDLGGTGLTNAVIIQTGFPRLREVISELIAREGNTASDEGVVDVSTATQSWQCSLIYSICTYRYRIASRSCRVNSRQLTQILLDLLSQETNWATLSKTSRSSFLVTVSTSSGVFEMNLASELLQDSATHFTCVTVWRNYINSACT